jgi:chitin synthase
MPTCELTILIEYEAEAWETGSHHTDETHHTGYSSKPRSRQPPPSRPDSPRSYHQASQSGDYYRDTNVTYNNSSNPNLRLRSQHSHSNLSHDNTSRQQQPPMSQYGLPQLPFMPFSGGPGSAAGSDYGHGPMTAAMQQMGYPQTGSVYGMMASAPRNTMMSTNMFGGGGGSQSGGLGGVQPSLALGAQQRPMSTLSYATTVGPLAGPSLNPNPSDDEVFNALRNYLSTQDLMTVTKKCVV